MTSLSNGAAVHIEGLQFAWPNGSSCLDVERLRIERGERVFLHGPSGSGKTTLLSVMAGIASPQSGAVTIAGQRLDALPPRRRDAVRADHVGILFQQFNLVPYLSILDNVLLPCRFSHDRRRRAEASGGTATAEALRLLGRLGIERAWSARPAARLSIGEQQRVAAARALVGSPALLIADEPTSALDDANTHDLLDLLLSECGPDSALLLVSHDLRLAERFDRRIAMRELNRLSPQREVRA